ncbi:MAG: hypothetical protein K2W94_00875 [Alphaproteobacteria bacterium]|nr:hypothetical protein [Alphaproteobacteria bacterium]
MLKWYGKYMTVVGVLGQFLFYSEFITILSHRSAQDVSLFGFVCGLISVTSWFVYGLLLKDKPLIITGVVATFGAILAVSAILIYR